jgi:NAD(P)-dependent dehydrogenase (short-subunit alcohol dehydrogenase family)
MCIDLKKKILILGGSSDISRELIKNIDLNKYKLFLHYNKNKPKLDTKNIYLIKTDFASLNKSNFKKKLKKFKTFDVIINLIGYIDGKSYFNSSYDSLLKSLNANFIAPMFIIRESIINMKKKKFGRIINCSSIGTKFGGGKNTFNYSIAKNCSEFIPQELRKMANKNVVINNIKIGVINTKIHQKISKKSISERIKLIPAKRIGKVEEIIKLIIFLINENSYISSETINISGGE